MNRTTDHLWHRPWPLVACGAAIGFWLPLLAGCEFPGQARAHAEAEAAQSHADFTGLFRQHCAGCHGVDGKLGPAPPLNDPLFLQLVTVDDVSQIIRLGRHNTPMPAFGHEAGGMLNEQQVATLANGMRTAWQPGEPTKVDDALPPYRPTATSGDRERGAEVYAKACAGCHGDQGQGMADDAGALRDPDFLALISDQALRRVIITGRPDLGMPTFAETAGRDNSFQPLTSAQIDDLVALLASWRGDSSAAKNP